MIHGNNRRIEMTSDEKTHSTGLAAMQDLTEKTLATERKYTGKIISVDLLDIELPDGRKAKREVIRHGNARPLATLLRKAPRFARRATRRLAARANVAILARRPDGKFVFVKQYRKAAETALVEVIAGGLEPGEDPMEGARRETAEETGYRQMNAVVWGAGRIAGGW